MVGLEIRNRGIEAPDDEYRFDAVLSDGSLDQFYTRMSDKTLDNFARQAQGKPFMNSHKTDAQSQIGYLISGQRSKDGVEATIAVLKDADSTPEAMRTAEFIRRIEKRMITGVSVGFKGGRAICEVCDADIATNPKCTHLPSPTTPFIIDDANLVEVSLTPVPANQNAYIMARAHDEQGMDKWGAMYRQEVIKEALHEGTRANGASFDHDSWRARFSEMEPEAIQDLTKLWRNTADNLFGQGRGTQDDPKNADNRVILPDLLFR